MVDCAVATAAPARRLIPAAVAAFVCGCAGVSELPYKPADVYIAVHTIPGDCRGAHPSYTIKGRRYWIENVHVGHTETGTASWYGRQFHGRKTASGEVFDMHRMSAAHKTLPLFSTVKVVNLDNGREVTVRINDRGPFAGERLIDLSYAAAKRLGMVSVGVAPVRVTVTGTPAGREMHAALSDPVRIN